jgi:hypothetical protein
MPSANKITSKASNQKKRKKNQSNLCNLWEKIFSVREKSNPWETKKENKQKQQKYELK